MLLNIVEKNVAYSTVDTPYYTGLRSRFLASRKCCSNRFQMGHSPGDFLERPFSNYYLDSTHEETKQQTAKATMPTFISLVLLLQLTIFLRGDIRIASSSVKDESVKLWTL
jgi:hypothetical protein